MAIIIGDKSNRRGLAILLSSIVKQAINIFKFAISPFCCNSRWKYITR
jgi:hypothetical protein